jgi:hypothetical protein
MSKRRDIAGRAIVLALMLQRVIALVEGAIGPHGRPPQRIQIVVPHSHILCRATWIQEVPDAAGTRRFPLQAQERRL